MRLPENRVRRGNTFKSNRKHEAAGNRNKERLQPIPKLRRPRGYDNRLFSFLELHFADNWKQFLQASADKLFRKLKKAVGLFARECQSDRNNFDPFLRRRRKNQNSFHHRLFF